MWLLIFFFLMNVLGLTSVFAALALLASERNGPGTWLVLAGGAGLVACGSYRLVHWITAWRRGHHAQLAANTLLYDSPVLPPGLDFLSRRMVAVVAAVLALLALGLVLRFSTEPARGGQTAPGMTPSPGVWRRQRSLRSPSSAFSSTTTKLSAA